MADAYIGEIRAFGFNFTPTGWLPCNGAIYSIQSNPALFSILGTNYGGNGTTTFAVPDLRGVAAIGINLQNPSFGVPGVKGGSENVTLTTATIPAHTHMMQAVVRTSLAQTAAAISQPGPNAYLTNAFSSGPGKGVVAYSNNTSGATLNPQAIGIAGGGVPHNNMDPYLAMTYCICASGVFPQHP
ncbi:Microcystin-dependent protein [Chitinophaga sp. YR627]|uniref:phage tail protein n=1 Tax=Chitinophaga sp. YR627 TaxID=1881041 RepID=UPI0008EDEA05|nr:tail fiber protein [Chitinophaga sp. YR627]SFM70321.1 Microcystin-dependent protein [Chitinophaga sp. YR627]